MNYDRQVARFITMLKQITSLFILISSCMLFWIQEQSSVKSALGFVLFVFLWKIPRNKNGRIAIVNARVLSIRLAIKCFQELILSSVSQVW